MMKILHVYKRNKPYSYGGIEETIDTIVNSKNNIYGTLAIGSSNRYTSNRQIKYYLFKESFSIRSCPFSLSLFLSFKKIINSYDLIHYHYPWPFMDLLHFLFASKKIPYLVTYHSIIEKQKFLKIIYKPLEQWFLKNAKVVIFTSQNYFEFYRKLNPTIISKSKIIPLGINQKPIIKSFAKPFTSKKYFIFIGQHRSYKGIELLISAMSKLPKINLLIIGSGALYNRHYNLSKKLKLKNIRFEKNCDDVKKIFFLQNSLALILPSTSPTEAFGISIIEAMSQGVPVISTNLGTGTSFNNLNNDTGFVIPPNNEDELIAKIKKLHSDSELRDEYAKNALKRFKNNFSSVNMIKKYNQVYAEIHSSALKN